MKSDISFNQKNHKELREQFLLELEGEDSNIIKFKEEL